MSVTNTALLVSRENYLSYRARMEEIGRDDPDWFPVPLWIWFYRGTEEDKPTIQTQGLTEFGLPELGFFAPELPPQDTLNYLFTMSSWQITGKQLYRNMALIPLTEELEVVSKQDGDTIFFIGGCPKTHWRTASGGPPPFGRGRAFSQQMAGGFRISKAAALKI